MRLSWKRWGGNKSFDNRQEIAGHDAVECFPGFFDAVVGDPILGEVIGADFFRPHAAAGTLAGLGGLRGDFFLLQLIKLGPEQVGSDFAVLFLKTLRLASSDNAGGFVS